MRIHPFLVEFCMSSFFETQCKMIGSDSYRRALYFSMILFHLKIEILAKSFSHETLGR